MTFLARDVVVTDSEAECVSFTKEKNSRKGTDLRISCMATYSETTA